MKMLLGGTLAARQLRRSTLEARFLARFELFTARVYRHVTHRADRAADVHRLVEKILVETVDEWMGPDSDIRRAARTLDHANTVIEADRLELNGSASGLGN
jgi:hypothetical protein